MHHANPGANGIVGVVDLYLLAIHLDFATVGAHQAVEDVHERGLAGAVLANEGVDFAFAHGEIHLVHGQHVRRGEVLAHAAHVHGELWVHSRLSGWGEAAWAASPLAGS